jgi:hypothetical protein
VRRYVVGNKRWSFEGVQSQELQVLRERERERERERFVARHEDSQNVSSNRRGSVISLMIIGPLKDSIHHILIKKKAPLLPPPHQHPIS